MGGGPSAGRGSTGALEAVGPADDRAAAGGAAEGTAVAKGGATDEHAAAHHAAEQHTHDGRLSRAMGRRVPEARNRGQGRAAIDTHAAWK